MLDLEFDMLMKGTKDLETIGIDTVAVSKWLDKFRQNLINIKLGSSRISTKIPETGLCISIGFNASSNLGCHSVNLSSITTYSQEATDLETINKSRRYIFPILFNYIIKNFPTASHFLISDNFCISGDVKHNLDYLKQQWARREADPRRYHFYPAPGEVTPNFTISRTADFIVALEHHCKQDPAKYGRVFSSEHSTNLVHDGKTAHCRTIIWESPNSVNYLRPADAPGRGEYNSLYDEEWFKQTEPQPVDLPKVVNNS